VASCYVVELSVLPGPVCFVHDEPAPCPYEGKDAPASPHPYHVFSEPDQAEQITTARHLTRGTRPIRVHEGTAGEPGHIVEHGKDCWCDPFTIPAG
jgi:hypothetical protein